MTQKKQNYGNAKVIFHHLEEDIRAFDIVGNSKSVLEFSNLVGNVAVTVKSFNDGIEF
jgi:hypothetical protein